MPSYPPERLPDQPRLLPQPGQGAAGNRPAHPPAACCPDELLVVEAAHYLANTVTVLSAAGDVLNRRRARLDPLGREALDLLTQETQRCQQTLTDLLELAHARTKQAASEQTQGQAQLVAPLVLRELAERGQPVPVRIAPEAQSAAAVVDSRRVARVVGNLLDNAARHAGGAASVEIGCNASHVWFTITDSEAGNSEPLPEADTFVRAGGAEFGADSPAGHGLGLALARAQTRLMGGELTVQRAPGGGTRTTTLLPLAASSGSPQT